MAITFLPPGGDVLLCDFGPDPLDPGTYPLAAGTVCAAPEMIKERHVVVLSASSNLVTVAPFSTQAPLHVRPYHHRITADTYPFFRTGVDSWLKGDVVASLSLSRFDRLFYNGRYQRARLSGADWVAVRKAVLAGLGLGRLKPYV